MPKYIFTGEHETVFGDLHYGVNAFSENEMLNNGSAVSMVPGSVVDIDHNYNHPFLELFIEEKPKAAKKTSTKTDAVVEETPAVSDPKSTPVN